MFIRHFARPIPIHFIRESRVPAPEVGVPCMDHRRIRSPGCMRFCWKNSIASAFFMLGTCCENLDVDGFIQVSCRLSSPVYFNDGLGTGQK